MAPSPAAAGSKPVTPLPVAKVATVALINLMNTASYLMTMPMVPWMVMHYFPGIAEHEVGFHSGLLEGTFHVGAFVGAIFWGWYADAYGRRPALLFGLMGTIISSVWFGLSETFWMAMVARFLWGALNGNVGTAKTALSELCDDTNSAKAFSFIGLNTGFGRIIGPVIGGLLSQPATKYPTVFGGSVMLNRFPFLLPCLVAAVMTGGCLMMTYFILEETKHLSMAEAKAYKEAVQGRGAAAVTTQSVAAAGQGRKGAKGGELDGVPGTERVERAAAFVAKALTAGAARINVGGGAGIAGRTKAGRATTQQHADNDNDEDYDEDDEEVPLTLDHEETHGGASGAGVGRAKARGPSQSSSKVALENEDDHDGHDDDDDDHISIDLEEDVRLETRADGTGPGGSSSTSASGTVRSGAGRTAIHGHDHAPGTASKDKGRGRRAAAVGTTGTTTSSTDDAKDSTPEESTLAGMKRLAGDSPVALACALYSALGLVGLVSNELFPLYMLNDPAHGGFNWDSVKVGVSGTAAGPFLVIFQAFVYDKLVRRFGLITLMRFSLGAFAVLLAVTPLQSLTNGLGQPAQDLILYSHAIVINVTRVTAFICVFVVVANSALPEDRGRVNGLGQASVSVVRALGPPLGTAAFAASVSPAATALGWPFNFHACWYGLSLLALGTLALTYELPEWISGKRPPGAR